VHRTCGFVVEVEDDEVEEDVEDGESSPSGRS
jgi:hypothetical protein